MSRFLADVLAAINGLIAFAIVLAGVLFGGITFGGDAIGLLLGAIIGMAVAGLACGTIAFLVLIEGHLRTIAEGRLTGRDDVRPAIRRAEPSL